MTCEKAEDFLSAYLDDMLDPQLRQEIEAHVQSCAHCREVLADYRRFDALLASVPRVAPPEELHDRIFASPEVAALIRQQGGRTSIPLLERPVATSNDSPAGDSGVVPSRLPARTRSSSPPWKRIALQSAAVFALLIGSALLIKQGLLRPATTSEQGTPVTIAGPQDKAPLSSGNRAVYARAGALWSVPESGPELAKQLTPDKVTVTGWAVSPNGQLIAYTDAAGRIHVIRSDDQRDTIIGSVSATALPGGFWTTPAGRSVEQGLAWSPDGSRIAYVGVDAAGYTALHVMTSAGAKDQTISSDSAASIGMPLWSADSSHLAFVATSAGSERLVAYDTATQQAHTLVSSADTADPSAAFAQVAWVPGSSTPALTWAASDAGTITGIFTQPAAGNGSAVRLTPSGAQYTAADFSAHGSGTWMVAAGNTGSATLSTLMARTAGFQASQSVKGGAITHIVWSPNGTTAAYVTRSGQLGLWSPSIGTSPVITSGASTPVWSADGSRLAAQAGNSVVSMQVANGQAQVTSRLITSSAPVTLQWAPDNQSLAISGPAGMLVAPVSGSVKIADSQPVDASIIAWTVAK